MALYPHVSSKDDLIDALVGRLLAEFSRPDPALPWPDRLRALADYATPIWLAQPDAALAAALRFHADAPLAATPRDAAFAYVHDTAALPPLEAFACGSAESPEQSATVFVRVDALTGGAPLTLSGPGIQTTQPFAPIGLPASLWQERAALAPLFPCGIDFYFVCGDQIVGLPRTTRVEVN